MQLLTGGHMMLLMNVITLDVLPEYYVQTTVFITFPTNKL
jgi:hypothetical protein